MLALFSPAMAPEVPRQALRVAAEARKDVREALCGWGVVQITSEAWIQRSFAGWVLAHHCRVVVVVAPKGKQVARVERGETRGSSGRAERPPGFAYGSTRATSLWVNIESWRFGQVSSHYHSLSFMLLIAAHVFPG